MGLISFNKKQEDDILKSPIPPTPPQYVPKKEELPKVEEPPKLDMEEIMKVLAVINNNLLLIYQEVKKPDEDLQFVPEEDKEEYLELKATKPKMAEKLLKEYRSAKKDGK